MEYSLSQQQKQLYCLVAEPFHDRVHYDPISSPSKSVLLADMAELNSAYLAEMVKVRRLPQIPPRYAGEGIEAEMPLTDAEEQSITRRVKALFSLWNTDSVIKMEIRPHRFKYYVWWLSATCDVELFDLMLDTYPEMFYGRISLSLAFDQPNNRIMECPAMIDRFVKYFVLPTKLNPQGYKSPDFDEISQIFFAGKLCQAIIADYDSRHTQSVNAVFASSSQTSPPWSLKRFTNRTKYQKVHPI